MGFAGALRSVDGQAPQGSLESLGLTRGRQKVIFAGAQKPSGERWTSCQHLPRNILGSFLFVCLFFDISGHTMLIGRNFML